MLPANYAINPSPLPISAAGVGIPSLPSPPPPPPPSTLVSLSEEVRDNALAGAHNFPGFSSSSSAATRHHLPCSAIPRNHLLLLLLLVSISLPPPLPPRQCGSFPTFLRWCLLGVSALTGWSRAGPITPEFTDGTTQYTAQGSRAAGLLTSVIIAAQLLLQPSSFSQLVLWHLLVAAHRQL